MSISVTLHIQLDFEENVVISECTWQIIQGHAMSQYGLLHIVFCTLWRSPKTNWLLWPWRFVSIFYRTRPSQCNWCLSSPPISDLGMSRPAPLHLTSLEFANSVLAETLHHQEKTTPSCCQTCETIYRYFYQSFLGFAVRRPIITSLGSIGVPLVFFGATGLNFRLYRPLKITTWVVSISIVFLQHKLFIRNTWHVSWFF